MNKTLFLTLALAAVACDALAFVKPIDTANGVTVSIIGFDQDLSDKDKCACAKYAVDKPVDFSVNVSNSTPKEVNGKLSVWLNADWQVVGKGEADLALAPGTERTLPFTARAKDCAFAALYPVHAAFADAHAIGVFEATGKRTAWKARPTRLFRKDANFNGATSPAERGRSANVTGAPPRRAVTTRRFLLDQRGERFEAVVSVGSEGVTDGSIAFKSLDNPAIAYRIDGFDLRVLLSAEAPKTNAFSHVETKMTDEALEVVHWLSCGKNRELPLKATFAVDRGALCLAWSMPGVKRDDAGLPRYEYLRAGAGDVAPTRVYCGFGNVMVRPPKFSLSTTGFIVSTRHAGADFPGGFSLVEALRFSGDTLDHDPTNRVFGFAAHHDNTFYFLPSAKGAFRAARNWRDVSGFRKSAGFDGLVGRMCLDEWGGDYREAADGLRKASRYGLNDAVFVKHVWQRWGYDYRLPEIYPPRDDAEGFFDLARACRETGVLFCPHDNYIDFYPDAEGYDYDSIVFKPNGTPQKAWLNKGRAAQSYRWLPQAFAPLLRRNCELIRKGFDADGLFIDVFTAAHNEDYCDRKGRFYPKMRTSQEWGDAFDNARKWLGKPNGPMISEAGNDHLVGHVDAGESDHFPFWRWTKAEDGERVPWHDMATHGRMILCAGGLGRRYAAIDWRVNGDEVRHGYASDDYLSNAVGGGRAPMGGGTFNRRNVMTYWLQHDPLASLARADFESLEFDGDDVHRFRTTFSNGAETYVNRSTNREWRVAGQTLPPYGYYVRCPDGESGIVLRDGQRCAFAKTKDTLFADARPYCDDCGIIGREVREVSRQMKGTKLVVELEWNIRRAIGPDYRPFVHVVPKSAKGAEKIVRHGNMKLNKNPTAAHACGKGVLALAHPHACGKGVLALAQKSPTSTLYVDFKGLDPKDYDVYYGFYDIKTGRRLEIVGCDSRRRMRLGQEAVTENADAVLHDLGVNTNGKMIDFGALRTNGALKMWRTRDGADAAAATALKLMALPGSNPFTVELDLAQCGLTGEGATITPAAKATCENGKLRFTYDPTVEAYTLRRR